MEKEGLSEGLRSERVARRLLAIGAMILSPQEPFTWSSGVRSPVYCDNRRLMSYPEARDEVESLWADAIRAWFPTAQVLSGVATAGIPHAAFLADRLKLPMVYVRDRGKDHGLSKTVEGVVLPGQKAVIVEDLISTGHSMIQVARELRSAGAEVLGGTAIVTYGFPQAEEALREADVPWFALVRMSDVEAAARKEGRLSEEELSILEEGMASVARQLRERSSRGPG